MKNRMKKLTAGIVGFFIMLKDNVVKADDSLIIEMKENDNKWQFQSLYGVKEPYEPLILEDSYMPIGKIISLILVPSILIIGLVIYLKKE